MLEKVVNVSGYRIRENIYNSSRTLVYRGWREFDQKPVVIKLLKNAYPSLIELAQFRNQYTITKNLNLPGVVQFYSLESCQNRLALIMEDFGGIALKDDAVSASYPDRLIEFLHIAIALAVVLDDLYRYRIIHKDIKPANILINPATRQVKLIDFSIASLLPKETQTSSSPNVLEGTLAYLSPEQTGRMNRGIDYRTDFYSLGVTFYELLTGQLPFPSEDPMELVHCHIAKQPAPVHSLNSAVPPLLSHLVSKLMAKNAEDRYQSALGLKYDLETCLSSLQATGTIAPFELGRKDVADRFVIPEKLYGREVEVEALLAAFERVQQGGSELMLVAGFSGIGKTAVVNEVHKPIARQRGYFIKGKFDQFQRNIPFSAFVQAFRDLMAQLLTESDIQIELWKTKILAALGENSQVIIEVVPELERIIGKQPAVPELPGSAVQNRFNLLFQKFIQVFTTQEHPLVMFLDDLQWADSASLKLMQLLMNEAESHYLFVIGAYRDNEVSAAHPLIMTLEEMRQAKVTINAIALSPLTPVQLNQLVAETLKYSLPQALPLTNLLHRKTQGNPFFSSQFLKALHDDKLITFDSRAGQWHCDLDQIQMLSLTDDVVELVARQLQKLPQNAQEALKLAACIGNQFNLETLAVVYEKSLQETAADLWQALKEGLILPNSEAYKFFQNEPLVNEQGSEQITVVYRFLHDRVQQAAYSLIPANQKQSTHLKIGQLLLGKTPDTQREDNLFEIVNQLNMGIELLTHAGEFRDELAQLNLMAGRKAKASAAHKAASDYFMTGINLLRTDCWQSQYELALTLHESAAEAACLNGAFDLMNQLADVVMQQAKSLLDCAGIYDIKIQSASSQNNLLEAIAIARQAMANFGVVLLDEPTDSDIQQALQETAALVAGRAIADLINLPVMSAEDKLAVMRIMSSVTPSVFIAAPNLFPLLILSQVRTSLEYGNAPFSAFGYACYGILLNGILQEVDTADQFGKLALSLATKFDNKDIQLRSLFVVGAFIIHWKSHLHKAAQLLREGYQTALDMGNVVYVGYCAKDTSQYFYFVGQELPTLEPEMRGYCHVLENLRQITNGNYCRIAWQAVLNLTGKSENPCILSGEAFNEAELLSLLLAANDFTGLHYFYLHKLILCYVFGDIAQAIATAAKARQYLAGVTGFAVVPVFHFYDSLTALATYATATPVEQELLLQRVAENQDRMQAWASHAPMNYAHKFELVAAERCRVLGQTAEALDHYDRAITRARANEFIQEEALANELAANFYLEWDKEAIAQTYLTNAYYGYVRWGANAKVEHLEQRYPQLLMPILHREEAVMVASSVRTTTSARSSSTDFSEALDLATVMKASHALSGQIELEKLLATLMQVVIENAGAENCTLLLLHEGNWVVAAQRQSTQLVKTSFDQAIAPKQFQLGEKSAATGLLTVPLESSKALPQSVINYVARTSETLVLDDARTQTAFANDAYIIQQQPQSLLCTPIHNRGKLIGILYLENNLAIGAFTQSRLEILRLLTAQAAISLQNAMLYNNLAVAKL